MKIVHTATRVAAIVVLSLFAVGAHAQATRTWVSGVGDDVNPCSRTAPCKTLAGAISKTADGGEIDVLDPAGVGGVTITKSITIDGRNEAAGVLVSASNGIVINAAIDDHVVLRGLRFEGLGSGLNGIRILQAASVVIEDVTIDDFRAGAPSGNGISIAPPAGVSIDVTLRNVRLNRNATGILVDGTVGTAAVLITDSVITATPDASPSTTAGIVARGANAVVTLGSSTIAHTTTALSASAGGQIQSFGNNRLTGNANASGPTAEIGEQ